MIRLRQLLAAGVMAVSGLALVGCSNVTAGEVRGDMSPNLFGTAQTGGQYNNMAARAVDHTGRQAWDDLAWLFLMESPSSLTEYPVPR